MYKRQGHRDIAALLLARGALANQAKQNGVTPLFIACQEGHRAVVELL